MKYIVRFTLKDPEIRADYRGTIISFFKKAISSYMGGCFYSELYENGTQQKPFTWSIRFEKPIFQGETITLGSKEIEMTLKFGEPKTALIYYSSLLEQKGKKFLIGNGNDWVLNSIKMIPEKDIHEEIVVFKVLSPICLRLHNKEKKIDRYLTVEDENFALEFQRKLEDELPYMKEEIALLKYDFSGLKKVIVPVYHLKIQVSIGEFIVAGNIKILNYILKNGVGSKRSSGFGLVERVLEAR